MTASDTALKVPLWDSPRALRARQQRADLAGCLHARLPSPHRADRLRGVRLHDLRHGVATALAKVGGDPLATSRIFGHASVVFTQSVYQHADDAMVERAAAGLAQAFGS